MLPQRRTFPSRSGASAVEFAMVAPVVFMLLFATFEFARYIYVANIIDHAAREGARQASVHTNDWVEQDVATWVNNQFKMIRISKDPLVAYHGVSSQMTITIAKVNVQTLEYLNRDNQVVGKVGDGKNPTQVAAAASFVYAQFGQSTDPTNPTQAIPIGILVQVQGNYAIGAMPFFARNYTTFPLVSTSVMVSEAN
jgi:Flp pilus assembly protein TadG